MKKLGNHIIVYGPTGSGKSTLARKISRLVGVPYIELDAVFWKPGWVQKPAEEFRRDVSEAIAGHPEGWVVDGNYSQTREITLPLADTVIWLRLPYRTVFFRLLRRTIARYWDGKLVCGQNCETWKGAFFSRDSLLLYQATHWQAHIGHTDEGLAGTSHHARVIELFSQKEVDGLLASLAAE